MTTSTDDPCLSCGATGLTRVRPYRAESAAGRALFSGSSLLQCPACRFVQMAPLPSRDALDRYYAEAYRAAGRFGSAAADTRDFPRDNMFFWHRGQSIVELVAPHITQRLSDAPSILDIGAGFGHILHAFGERYPASRRHAVEISRVCVDHLKAIGVAVPYATTEDFLAGPPGTYDVLVLSHVLEHLRDPVEVLRQLRERLTPNGLLYVEVPHVPSDMLTRYLVHAWAPRHDEPHLTFFDHASLRGALARAGLQVMFSDTAGPEFAEVSWATFHLPSPRTIAMKLIPEAVKRALRRRRIGSAMSVFDHKEPFYHYGGRGIWLRSISAR